MGTLQDRLVSELRLANVTTTEEANAFLSAFLARYNRTFSVAPATPGSAYRPRLGAAELEQTLCFKHERVVSNDNIARLGQVILQILPGPKRLGYAKATVVIHESLDHRFSVHYEGRHLPAKLVPLQKFLAPKPPPRPIPVPADVPQKPSPHHLWRNSTQRKVTRHSGHIHSAATPP